MSRTGRACDLLAAWRDHPRDCNGEHDWAGEWYEHLACTSDPWDIVVALDEINPMYYGPFEAGHQRPCVAGTSCAIEPCSTDAVAELLHKIPDEEGCWVPVCQQHLEGPHEGLEYIVETHGFLGRRKR